MAQDPFGPQVNIPRFEPPKLPPGVLKWGIIVFAVVAVLASAFYQVEADEVGVVLRFGVHIENTEPGLRWKIPLVDTVTRIPVQRQLTAEFGFETPRVDRSLQFSRDELAGQSNMLTGDLNSAVVEWVVQYRIVDPVAFLFKVRNAEDTFRDMSEAVMREAVGDRTVNEVITIGRQELSVVVLKKLQVLNDLYETGIQVEQVVLQDVTPPNPVKPAFNQVNEAEQEKSKLISQAQSEYNMVVPRARGEAQQTILAAEGYAVRRVNEAKGNSTRFVALYDEYRKAPEVTRKRLYLETLGRVLPRAGTKLIVDEDVRGVLPLLNLDGLRSAVKSEGGGQ